MIQRRLVCLEVGIISRSQYRVKVALTVGPRLLVVSDNLPPSLFAVNSLDGIYKTQLPGASCNAYGPGLGQFCCFLDQLKRRLGSRSWMDLPGFNLLVCHSFSGILEARIVTVLAISIFLAQVTRQLNFVDSLNLLR